MSARVPRLIRPNIPEDLEDLINFRITREQWLASAHLRKDSSARPHVNASRVLTTTEKNFRGAIPKGNDLATLVANKTMRLEALPHGCKSSTEHQMPWPIQSPPASGYLRDRSKDSGV